MAQEADRSAKQLAKERNTRQKIKAEASTIEQRMAELKDHID
jgi:hypothetical protein